MHMRKHCTVSVMMAEAAELAHAHNSNGICSVKVKLEQRHLFRQSQVSLDHLHWLVVFPHVCHQAKLCYCQHSITSSSILRSSILIH